MPKKLLFGDDDDAPATTVFTVNENYAKRYEKWRKNEEFERLKARLGNVDEEESSSEESDEDAQEVTPAFEQNFFETLSVLKKRDPTIYEADTVFFKDQGSQEDAETKPKKKSKKQERLYLKDYDRKMIEEKGTLIISDEEEEQEDEREDFEADDDDDNNVDRFVYDEEQRALKASFKKAFAADDDDDSDDDGEGLLKTVSKSEAEATTQEEEYRRWLKGETDKIAKSKHAEKLEFLRDYWSKSENLDETEGFLRDYILNRRYLDKGTSSNDNFDALDLEEDEELLEEQTQFEHKYNFRYEEPDADFIKRYPRTVELSMRTKDVKRKEKRQEIRERKKRQKEKLRDEINRFKALKKREVMTKLEAIQRITGTDRINFDDEDLEGDFDPEKHDQRMKEVFNDEYYQGEEEEYPECPTVARDQLAFEDWDAFQGDAGNIARTRAPTVFRDEENDDYGGGDDDDDDAGPTSGNDYDDDGDDQQQDDDAEKDEQMTNSERAHGLNKLQLEDILGPKKSRIKRSKFAEMAAREKTIFDPKKQSFDEWFAENYRLEFEDLVGDLPTRFRYREVPANDFGLTVDEILKADDKELNQWAPIKKSVQYLTPQEEDQNYRKYQNLTYHEDRKKRILQSLYRSDEEKEDGGEGQEEATTKKKRRKKKKKHGTLQDLITELKESKVSTVAADDDEKTNDDATTAESRAAESAENNDVSGGNQSGIQSRRKRKRGKNQQTPNINNSDKNNANKTVLEPQVKKAKLGNKNKVAKLSADAKKKLKTIKMTDSRIAAYGFDPDRIKKTVIYSNKLI